MIFTYITCKDGDEARKISYALIKNKAAASVNAFPIQSIYSDNGEVKERRRVAMIVKTMDSKLQDITDIVRQTHTSENPCIASLTLHRLNPEFKEWINARLA